MAKQKHPRDMTNDEAIKHLFHPKVVEHVKAVVKKANAAKPKKKATSDDMTKGLSKREPDHLSGLCVTVKVG